MAFVRRAHRSGGQVAGAARAPPMRVLIDSSATFRYVRDPWIGSQADAPPRAPARTRLRMFEVRRHGTRGRGDVRAGVQRQHRGEVLTIRSETTRLNSS